MAGELNIQKLIQAWVNMILKGYAVIIAVALVLAYVGFDSARKMQLDTDITSLMPDGVASVDNLNKVVEKTGGYSSIMVVVNSPDPDANIRFLDDLRSSVMSWDWCQQRRIRRGRRDIPATSAAVRGCGRFA